MAIDYGKGRAGGGAYLNIRPGDELELDVLGSTIEASKFPGPDGNPREDVVLIVDVNGEGAKWRLNVGANLALDEAGVDVGDRIRVARDDDDVSSGRTQSVWRIEKLDRVPF